MIADESPDISLIIGLTMGMGLLVFVIVATTSFIKIAVVLFIVRSALGIQQTPPNVVLYAIALALTAFVTAPVFTEIYTRAFEDAESLRSLPDWMAALERGKEPVRAFLLRYTSPEQREFFLAASSRVWPEGTAQPFSEDDLSVLIPSFLAMELQRAFEIGLLLYLPMVVVDLVVTTVLMAMGMSMVTPTIIATPVKLFLFVSISGWTSLVEGLVLTYAT